MGLPTTLCGFLWARRAAADALGVEPEQTVSPSASLRRGQDAGEEGDEAAERLKLCCLARNHMLDATLHLLGLQAGPGAELSLADFRKDIIIDLFNEAGQKVISYNVFRCWVSEYQALPDLDANANAVAIQTLKLENEGWERDTAVTEPTEPSFTFPPG